MGQAFLMGAGGGGYAEGDTIPTANLQPVYSALDFTKTFVTNTYSPNTTTAWSNILDTFILSDGVTVLQITTTAFNLFKISEPLTLVVTATHDSYSSSGYRSDSYQKFTVNEILGQFYVLYNGYIHSYSLTTLTEQWNTQYNSSDWSASDAESICINPTDHTPWYIGNKKLIRYNPTTGAATQTYTITSSNNEFQKSYIYDGVIYGVCMQYYSSAYQFAYASWNLSTSSKVLDGTTGHYTFGGLKEWFLYQNYLFYADRGNYDFGGYRVNMASSSGNTNSIDVESPRTLVYSDTDDEDSEYYYHPTGITSDGNLFLVLGPIRYQDGTDDYKYAAVLIAGCGTLTKTMSFSGTGAATQVATRSIGSVWNYNYRIPIKGPNYPVIGSEGFCYYPHTNDSAITQVTNLPTGYKVLSED